MIERLEICVPDKTPRTRLEEFLFEYFPHLSRMYIREAVRDSRCEVNGRFENVGFRVRGGDLIEIEIDRSRETAMRPADIPLDIVFEDEHLIVINKPAGMLVHPTHREKNGTLLNALTFYLNAKPLSNVECGMRNAEFPQQPFANRRMHSAFRTPHSTFPTDSAFIRPGLVHRLDKQTSGLILIAKSVRVHRLLARQFQKKRVEKKYLALVEGVVENDGGVIEGTIGRYADEKRWDVKLDGKHSETRYQVRERYINATLLELEPVTGRTNQLRIHCASIGHPIVGDISRGGPEFHRLCLHAWKLIFAHPVTSQTINIESPISFNSASDQG